MLADLFDIRPLFLMASLLALATAFLFLLLLGRDEALHSLSAGQ